MNTRAIRARKALQVVLVLFCVGWLGYIVGFSSAVGGLSFGTGSESIAPPADITKATLAEVTDTIESVAQMEYREGFNCLDFAWEGMRQLHWAGQLATVARLDLEPGPDHAVLLIPTTDKGWVLIEPQTGKRIYPTAGGKYIDFTSIEGVYVMRLEWTPIDIYELSIAEGVVDTSALSYYTDNE